MSSSVISDTARSGSDLFYLQLNFVSYNRSNLPPSTKNSSVDSRSDFGKDGLWTIQNSNSGEVKVLLFIPLLYEESGAWLSTLLGLSMVGVERERGGKVGKFLS